MERKTIGRASDNDMVFDAPTISSHHADIIFDNGRMILTDHSTNGTWVNGRKIHNDSCEINYNDKILLPGNVTLNLPAFAGDSKGTQKWDSHSTVPMSNHHANGQDRGQYEAHFEAPSGYAEKTMSFGDSISHVFSHYADFSGRARRSEYWWFILLNGILMCIPYLGIVWALAAVIPSLAVAIRRLHDLGKSGWYYLFCLIPIVGAIMLIVWFCQDGEPNANEYGVSPKYK